MKEIKNSFINKKRVKEILKYNGHKEFENNYQFDKNLKKYSNSKIVVYTCITGGYDKLIDPFMKFENIDYVAFTDNKDENSKIWETRDIPEKVKKLNNNILINRYIKFHPIELFKGEYDYAIYIDGNIKVISDFTHMIYGINEKTGLAFHRHQFRNCIYKEVEVCRIVGKGDYLKMQMQINRYRENGFKENFGLYECNVIVTDLKNKNSKKILSEWWNEFSNSESFRDQIALPYVIWKNGFEFDDIGSLGNNVYKNPKLRLENHKK